eukprot:10824688-Alexandrium_andersonii.AAC.1
MMHDAQGSVSSIVRRIHALSSSPELSSTEFNQWGAHHRPTTGRCNWERRLRPWVMQRAWPQ